MRYHDIAAQSQTRGEVSTSFMVKVYGWMMIGLLVTAGVIGAMVVTNTATVVVANPILFYGLIIAEFGLVFWLSFRAQHMSGPMASSLFLLYAALNGLTLAAIFAYVYQPSVVGLAFVITAAMFGSTCLYGATTHRDLTTVGSLAVMGLIGLIIASIANIFLGSGLLDYIISYVGVLIFVGLTAWEAQRIKQAHDQGFRSQSVAIIFALMMYLNFVNMLLFVLRILGGRD